jgi:hypothetical protein
MTQQNMKKRHHYIPVFYLNGFSDQDRRLCVYDKNKISNFNDVLIKNANSTAFENNGYTIISPDGTKDSESIENKFKETEDIAAPLLKKIINGQKLNNEELGVFIWNFIAPIAIRTPLTGSTFKTIWKVRLGIEPDKQETLESQLYTHEGTVEVLRNANWNFFEPLAGNYFLTSDNPFLSIKFDNKNVIFILPLSKEFCAIGSPMKNIPMDFLKRKAELANYYIIKYAYRQVYCHLKDKKIYELVKKYKDEHGKISESQVREAWTLYKKGSVQNSVSVSYL